MPVISLKKPKPMSLFDKASAEDLKAKQRADKELIRRMAVLGKGKRR